jgi:thymidylate synthase
LPRLRFARKPPGLFDYEFEDFEFLDYRHHEAIKAPIAV